MTTPINKYIDHTILKADTQEQDIIKLCKEAIEYDFMSVCVQPYWVKQSAELLKDSTVKVCTVVGFPLGTNTKEVKEFETKQVIQDGADEVDMVINIGALKDGDVATVKEEIELLVAAVKGHAILKVIIETSLLTEEEIQLVSQIVQDAGADFVKTSTGFSTRGASLRDVELIKNVVGDKTLIKASGGVANYDEALEFIAKGADRLGSSKGLIIMSGKK